MDPEDEQLKRDVVEIKARLLRLEGEIADLRGAQSAPGNHPSSVAYGSPAGAQADRSSEADAAQSYGPRNTMPGNQLPDHRAAAYRPQPSGAFPAATPGFAPVPAAGSPVKRPSLETRIASQLFNRVGIIALLVGVALSLKFAIDNHWIGLGARVLVGVAIGIGLIAWSERFRSRGYKTFSYSLKAVGTGVLYLSLWAAYTLFSLIPGSVAFLAMVLVTAGNAWLCWRQNSEVLAFYAAVGGFITPLLLWSSEGRELALFSYLLLLDLGVLALVALRPWSRLLLAGFAGTAFYAVGWYVMHYTPAAFGMTMFFVVVFFLLFSIAPQMLRNLRLATPTTRLTFEDNLVLLLLPVLNATLAFAELYAVLSEPVSTMLRPWIAFGFSAFYLVLLKVARSRAMAGAPTRLPDTYVLLSVLSFTAAIPLAFHGRMIGACWAAESVLIFALAERWAMAILRQLGTAVLLLVFVATIALNGASLRGEVTMFFNARFFAYLAGAGACAAVAWIAGRARFAAGSIGTGGRGSTAPLRPPSSGAPAWAPYWIWAGADWAQAGAIAGVCASLLLMIAVCLEISTYWHGQLQLPRADRVIYEQFSYSAWSMLFGAALLAAGFWRRSAFLRWQGLVLLTLSMGKVFLFDLRDLSQGYGILSFIGLGVLLLAISFVYQRDLLGLRKAAAPPQELR